MFIDSFTDNERRYFATCVVFKHVKAWLGSGLGKIYKQP